MLRPVNTKKNIFAIRGKHFAIREFVWLLIIKNHSAGINVTYYYRFTEE